jgi:hypothetical protein
MQHVREERVGGEVDARAPAGDEPEAPRDRRLPVGPPYARLLVHGLRGPAALVEHARESDEEDGHGPRHERQSPIAAGERQHDGNRERRGERLAHQEPVRIDGGPERDLARHPLAHEANVKGRISAVPSPPPSPHTVLSYLPCLPERGGGRYIPPRRAKSSIGAELSGRGIISQIIQLPSPCCRGIDSLFVVSLRPANKLLGQAASAKSLGKATSAPRPSHVFGGAFSIQE